MDMEGETTQMVSGKLVAGKSLANAATICIAKGVSFTEPGDEGILPVLALLRSDPHEEVSDSFVAEWLGIRLHAAMRALRRLHRAGVIVRSGAGTKSQPFRYAAEPRED